jgi:hypothetical protein
MTRAQALKKFILNYVQTKTRDVQLSRQLDVDDLVSFIQASNAVQNQVMLDFFAARRAKLQGDQTAYATASANAQAEIDSLVIN